MKTHYLLATIACMMFAIQCGENGITRENKDGGQDLGINGYWRLIDLETTGVPDSSYIRKNSDQIIHIRDSIWEEYARAETKTLFAAVDYFWEGDSVVVFTSNRGLAVRYGITSTGDTLTSQITYYFGMSEKAIYVPYEGEVPPADWPQEIEEVSF